jgi:HEAT repeat protein
MRLPHFPPIDPFSFWLGFGSTAFIVFVLYLFRRQLAQAREMLGESLLKLRETLTAGEEKRFREDTLRFAQTSHLAGSIFALNEILLPPRLLHPEPPIDPTMAPSEDDVTAIIPIIAEWPDLASAYRASSLSVDEVFAGEATNILILGGPGAGKSTLLAHLATRAAQDDEKLFPEGITPIFVHAADLDLPYKDDTAQPLIAAALARASTLTASQLPQHLKLRLRGFKCFILLDGLDELPGAQVAQVTAWLGEFQKQYPNHRYVAATGVAGYGPLVSLGFTPVLIAPWSADDYRALIKKWTTTWDSVIRARRKKAAALPDVDPIVMQGWLNLNNQGRTIYEITLKVWAAVAGDARGNRPVDWLEAYVRRFNLKPSGPGALGKLATALLNQPEAFGVPRKDVATICDTALKGADGKTEIDSDDFIDDLVNRRMLVKHAKDQLSFTHALTMTYCAAQSLAAQPDTPVGDSPIWARALYFFAALGDLTPIVGRAISRAADVLQTELLTCALWLRDAPASARWRPEIFKRLARLMMDPNQPENLRLRALAGFVASNDPAVVALFKQALVSPDPFNRRVAILGLGAIGDPTLVPQILALYADPYLDVRWAAALALSNIASDAALDGLAQGLLQGDDPLKQACAQSLARNVEEGQSLLKEAVKHTDLGVRRAALYGLAEIKDAWALEMLEAAQTDEQWFVRNAATDLVERLKNPSPLKFQPYSPPESQGWLIAWAATKGTGVPPGKGAIDLLNRALKEGEERVRLAAAQSLGRLGDPLAARELYAALRDPAPLIRDAAFRALAHIAALTGQKMASPTG